REIENRQSVLVGGADWQDGLRLLLHARLYDFNRRNESIAPARDCLDELRRSRIVSQHVTQFGDGLRERVLGDVRPRPERVEQLLFRDQRIGVVEQMEQQVEKLGRNGQRLAASEHAIANPIHHEWAEPIRGTHHCDEIVFSWVPIQLRTGSRSRRYLSAVYGTMRK